MSRSCHTAHTCGRCSRETYCNLPSWECPWNTDDVEEQFCVDCLERNLQEWDELEAALEAEQEREAWGLTPPGKVRDDS